MNQYIPTKHIKLIENLLIILLFLRVCLLTYQALPLFQNKFNYFAAREIYNHSQYNLGKDEFFGNMDDDLLYQLAGFEYINGHDPSTINSEVPFLGKYIYGVSIYLFGSALVLQFVIGIGILGLMYWLMKMLKVENFISYFLILLFSFEPLFISQLKTSLLDLQHTFWILMAICLTIIYLNTKTHNQYLLIFLGLTIGAIATTKLWVTGLIVWLVVGLIFWLRIKNYADFIKKFGIVSISSITLYLATHFVFFYYHPNPLDFITLHINTLKLYKSYLPEYPWGEMLRIIILGQWQTWWGSNAIVPVAQWSIMWPLGLLASLCVFWKGLVIKNWSLILISVVILFYVFSNLFHVVFPRYVLSVLPLMYVALSICFGWYSKRNKL